MPIIDRKAHICLFLLFSIMTFGAALNGSRAAEEGKVFQAVKPLNVDGSLDDWAGVEEIPVERTPEGRVLAPSADLTVTARLSFDAENFYAGVKVVDDQLDFPTRRLHEGDSFYITIVDPGPAGESRRYSTYGFSFFRGEEIKMLVSRNGKRNVPSFVKDIQVKIKPAPDRKSAIYEVAIPWRYIPDFRPFLQPVWGINLAYIDYDAQAHKTVQLVSDMSFLDDLTGSGPGFAGPMPGPDSIRREPIPSEIGRVAPPLRAPDAESSPAAPPMATAARKGRGFRFVPGEPAAPEFQSLLSANRYFPRDEMTVSLAVNSPSAHSGWELVMLLSSPEGSVQSKKSLAFDRGMSILKVPIEISKPVWGVYDFSLGLLDEKGALRFSDDKQFFLIQPPEFEAVAAKIAEAKKGDLYAKDAVFRESLPTLEIRLLWTEEFMKSADPYADIDPLRRWNEEIKELLRNVEAGRPALFPAGRAASLGYRSPVDGALKSYAVVIPEWYDKSLKFPCSSRWRGGHGGQRNVGFFEAINFSPRVGRRAGDLIFMEPSTEMAQGWYAGEMPERRSWRRSTT